jgi:acetoin utilization protein AcuB
MKTIPPIKAVMTAFPHSVEGSQTIAAASSMMAAHNIRHLPVTEGSKPIGVVTDRDIQNARQLRPGSHELRIKDVCVGEIYVVGLTEPLDRVLMHMAENHIESTLVVKDGKLVGIFTTTDVCRSFSLLLRTLFPKGGDDAA